MTLNPSQGNFIMDTQHIGQLLCKKSRQLSRLVISVPSWSWSEAQQNNYTTVKAFFCPLKKVTQKGCRKELLSNEKGCKRLNHENDYRVVLAEIEKKLVKMRNAGSLANNSFSWRVYVFSAVLFCLTNVNSTNWQENIRPKLFAKLNSRDYQSFSGTLKV